MIEGKKGTPALGEKEKPEEPEKPENSGEKSGLKIQQTRRVLFQDAQDEKVKKPQTGLTKVASCWNNEERASNLFEIAKDHIRTGFFFRRFSQIFSERKLIVAFSMHFFVTMIIWGHFAIIKFRTQEGNLPPAAPNYGWKLYTPTLEFGSMHAILFQMGLIPLTMSRYTIASLGTSWINKIIPMNRMTRFHIHLGYTMILIVVFATFVFFGFFGKLCRDGEEAFCEKFTMEIMITGYVIFILLLLVLITSFFRESIAYEIFYYSHHLVFAMFIIAIAHTFDDKQRKGLKDRSLTFKWFAASLLYYCIDRTVLRVDHCYRTSVLLAVAITGNNGTKKVVLRVRRPHSFLFQPGQYAYIRVKEIDRINWHPFSIASAPESESVEFSIAVCRTGSWTHDLWELVKGKGGDHTHTKKRFEIEIMGPYGTALGKMSEYSHAITIGSGTGIVPMLSLLKQHIRRLMRLHPEMYFEDEANKNHRVNLLFKSTRKIEGTIIDWIVGKVKPNKGTNTQKARRQSNLATNLLSLDQSSEKIKDIKKAALSAKFPVYRDVCLLIIPVFGVIMLSIQISWNFLSMTKIKIKGEEVLLETFPAMATVLMAGSLTFQALYLLEVLFVHCRSSLLTYVDICVIMIAAGYDYTWTVQDAWCMFSYEQMILSSIFMGYMTIRSWLITVDKSSSFYASIPASDRSPVLSKLHFVWVTRSASHASEILPDIKVLWDLLIEGWGEEFASKVCKISVYITDRSYRSNQEIEKQFANTSLMKDGIIHFGRPDIKSIVDSNMLERIIEARTHEGKFCSNTLLAFCGSPSLSAVVHEAKLKTEMAVILTGNKNHKIDYVSENYGITSSDTDKDDSQMQAKFERTTSIYPGGESHLEKVAKVIVEGFEDSVNFRTRGDSSSSNYSNSSRPGLHGFKYKSGQIARDFALSQDMTAILEGDEVDDEERSRSGTIRSVGGRSFASSIGGRSVASSIGGRSVASSIGGRSSFAGSISIQSRRSRGASNAAEKLLSLGTSVQTNEEYMSEMNTLSGIID